MSSSGTSSSLSPRCFSLCRRAKARAPPQTPPPPASCLFLCATRTHINASPTTTPAAAAVAPRRTPSLLLPSLLFSPRLSLLAPLSPLLPRPPPPRRVVVVVIRHPIRGPLSRAREQSGVSWYRSITPTSHCARCSCARDLVIYHRPRYSRTWSHPRLSGALHRYCFALLTLSFSARVYVRIYGSRA